MLLNAGFSRARALVYNALSGLAAVVGGVIGYFVVGPWEALFPYLLVVAASSFIYVAVADLHPAAAAPAAVARDGGAAGVAGCRPGVGSAGGGLARPRRA